jgi:hypothetical protein
MENSTESFCQPPESVNCGLLEFPGFGLSCANFLVAVAISRVIVRMTVTGADWSHLRSRP